MYSHIIYKKEGSSVHYILEAENYLRRLDYYVHSTSKNEIDKIATSPHAVFILTSETDSSYITQEQYMAMDTAHDYNIPWFVIYKKKRTRELNIYKAQVRTIGTSSISYGKLHSFIKTEDLPYTMSSVADINKTKSCSKVKTNKEKAVAKLFIEDENEELLLVLY
jgi:hypothetical protein